MNWFFTKTQRLGVVVNEAEQPVYSVRVDNTFEDLLLSNILKWMNPFTHTLTSCTCCELSNLERHFSYRRQRNFEEERYHLDSSKF